MEIGLGLSTREQIPFFWRNETYDLLGLCKELRTNSPQTLPPTPLHLHAHQLREAFSTVLSFPEKHGVVWQLSGAQEQGKGLPSRRGVGSLEQR